MTVIKIKSRRTGRVLCVLLCDAITSSLIWSRRVKRGETCVRVYLWNKIRKQCNQLFAGRAGPTGEHGEKRMVILGLPEAAAPFALIIRCTKKRRRKGKHEKENCVPTFIHPQTFSSAPSFRLYVSYFMPLMSLLYKTNTRELRNTTRQTIWCRSRRFIPCLSFPLTLNCTFEEQTQTCHVVYIGSDTKSKAGAMVSRRGKKGGRARSKKGKEWKDSQFVSSWCEGMQWNRLMHLRSSQSSSYLTNNKQQAAPYSTICASRSAFGADRR